MIVLFLCKTFRIFFAISLQLKYVLETVYSSTKSILSTCYKLAFGTKLQIITKVKSIY